MPGILTRSRYGSPARSGSTLITSAPKSPMMVAAAGPAMKLPTSRTVMPSRMRPAMPLGSSEPVSCGNVAASVAARLRPIKPRRDRGARAGSAAGLAVHQPRQPVEHPGGVGSGPEDARAARAGHELGVGGEDVLGDEAAQRVPGAGLEPRIALEAAREPGGLPGPEPQPPDGLPDLLVEPLLGDEALPRLGQPRPHPLPGHHHPLL